MMDVELVKALAYGKLDWFKEKLWNPRGDWPTDFDDPEQNPHGRPKDYYISLVDDHRIRWDGISGWPTREKALEAGEKFRKKCRLWLEKNC